LRLLPKLIHKDRLGDTELKDKTMTMAKNIEKEALIRQQLTIMSRKDSFDVLARVFCLTVVICGRQNYLTPLAQHQTMVDAMLGANLIAIKDSRHLSPIEQPHAVSTALRYRLKV
jgi:pimeloyl-ACP methyl ester carboxylesterase